MEMRNDSDGEHTHFSLHVLDVDLQEQVQAVKLIVSDAGKSMICGVLLSHGVNVSLARMCFSS